MKKVQRLCLDQPEGLLQFFFGAVNELARALVGSRVADEVERCEPRLPPRAHKHQHRLYWRVRLISCARAASASLSICHH